MQQRGRKNWKNLLLTNETDESKIYDSIIIIFIRKVRNMNLKKLIGMFMAVIIILCTILAIGEGTTYAANANYVLGITNVREARKWKKWRSLWNWHKIEWYAR